MKITFYNTISGKKEEFKPQEDGKIKMYVCGVTVYDRCHIGHARSQVVFDTLSRYLRYRGYNVTYVRNFTDVDDKIINRSKEEKIHWKTLAEKYIDAFYDDMEKLNVLKPEYEPRATEHIPDMIKIIENLLKKGYAYAGSDGVYFKVKEFTGYGKLSHRKAEEMMAGARVEPGEGKRDPLDFALWKFSKPDEPSWKSPWGDGRPGWHIECSTMSMKYLGPTLDIHGGGIDLIFPHHENEIAQSEASTGISPFVKYWIHNGFLLVRGEKMSKSLGNFYTIEEILKDYHPEALRLFLLTKHYRSPLNFTPEALKENLAALERFYFSLYIMAKRLGNPPDKPMEEQTKEKLKSVYPSLSGLKEKFEEAMNDDLNTPQAIGVVFESLNELNRYALQRKPAEHSRAGFYLFSSIVKEVSKVLGVFGSNPAEFISSVRGKKCIEEGITVESVEKLIEERQEARKNKNFQRADEIRDNLKKKGIILEDYPEGTEWRVQF